MWPTSEKGGDVILSSIRPEHSLATARWTISDTNGREWGPTGGYKSQAKTEGISIHKLKWESWMDDVNEILVKVQWSNVNSPNAVYQKLLKKSSQKITE